MEMVAAAGHDFRFDSTCTTPYVSAPSSPSHKKPSSIDVDDFAFDFSSHLDNGLLPPDLTDADELFDMGKIRALKPPPRLQLPSPDNKTSSPPSTRSRSFMRSPRRGAREEDDFDPFTAAMVEVTRDRGRERISHPPYISSSRSKKGSRSLSPLRRGEEGDFNYNLLKSPFSSSPAPSVASTSSTTTPRSGGGSKKWRLRDLLLFRSASEGRATGNRSKDPLGKFTMLNSSSALIKKGGDDSNNSSFRSTGSAAPASPHEKHYTANRAAAAELKKKTPLAYRQGLFGCLRLNPAVHSMTRGFNSRYSFSRGDS